MQKIKIAVIGVGSISGVHINGYLKNPNVELYAFCDINEETLKTKGEKYGISRLYTDEETMLRELPEIDAVSVCTWNSAHAPCTILALQYGKHVLCEKPMAMNAAEARAMIDASKKYGKKLMIGFVRRFGNDAAITKDFIDAGNLGDVYYAKTTYLRRNGCPGGWFGDKSRSGGGPLIDLGVHVIDFVRYALGNPKPISVYGATFAKLGNRPELKTSKEYVSADHSSKEICDVEDLASAMIRFDNGAVLSVESSFSLNIQDDKGEIEFFGDKGGAKIDPELKIYSTANGYMTDISLKAKTALEFSGLFQKEIDHYVDCLLGNAECRSPAIDGYEIMRILDAIYESARTGHEVVL